MMPMKPSILLAALCTLSACGTAPPATNSPSPDEPVDEPSVNATPPVVATSEAGKVAPQVEQPSAGTAIPATSACLMQGDRPVPENAIRAIGTEPFWGASVNGRCVTYSTPENQAGARVWTQFSGTAASGTRTGALDGKPFVMTTKAEPGCSDGMSDERYPISVELRVHGETRRGCAEPR